MAVAEVVRPMPAQEVVQGSLERPTSRGAAGAEPVRVSQYTPDAPRYYMDGGVLFHWGTETRKMTSSEDLGMFGTSPRRVRALLERHPDVTVIVSNRELVSRDKILRKEGV